MTEFVRAKVTGPFPMRDARTRASVPPGGVVTLAVRPPGTTKVVCARHPRKGGLKPAEPCGCGATLLAPLLDAGLVELLPEPKGK